MSKIKIIGVLFFTAYSLIGLAQSDELPAGWRFPTESDLTGVIREASKEKFLKVDADFNGDGVNDKAFLVKSTIFSGQALLVKLSKNKKYIWLELDRIDWGKKYPNVSLSMGISLIKPGEYKTACGKGYWNCTGEETPTINIKYPSIDYFKFGSANSVFYWDESEKQFKRVWLSD